MVAVGIVLARGEATARRPHNVTLLLIAAALIATHHLTAYGLAVLLWIVVGLSLRRPWRRYRPLTAAMPSTTAGAAAWFFFVATDTRRYLSYIVGRATDSVQQVLSSGGTHLPFQSSSSGGLQTPFAEQIVSYVGVVVLAIGVIAGLVRYRRPVSSIQVGPARWSLPAQRWASWRSTRCGLPRGMEGGQFAARSSSSRGPP